VLEQHRARRIPRHASLADIRRTRNQAESEDDELSYLCSLLLYRIRQVAVVQASLGHDQLRWVTRRETAMLADRQQPVRPPSLRGADLQRAVAGLTEIRAGHEPVSSDEQLAEARKSLESGLARVVRRQDEVWAELDELSDMLDQRRATRSKPLDVPFSVYVAGDDHEAAAELADAIAGLFQDQVLRAVPDGPPVISSWWQRFTVRARATMSKPEIAARLEKVEHAIEVAALHDPMSKVNVQQADAMSRLLIAAEKCDNFVALAGSIVLVKHTDEAGRANVYAKTLSVAEVRAFERNQHLLTSPAEALRHLELLSAAAAPAAQIDEAVQ
jgi:hypothetical protein